MTVANLPMDDKAHGTALDQALRDARLQVPHKADASRANRGLVLALNGHVTLHTGATAHVTSGSDAEVIYHVSRWACDCPDSVRRREQAAPVSPYRGTGQALDRGPGQAQHGAGPDTAPGLVFCKHQFAVALLAMAHVNLQLKGYVPEPVEVWYPALYIEDDGRTWRGHATQTADDGWWFQYGDDLGGHYCSRLSLALWEMTPVHVLEWRAEVCRWERWLRG